MLNPGETALYSWPKSKRQWYRIGMPRDGSCFFHALCFALTGDETGGIALRQKLADLLTEDQFYQLQMDIGKVAEDNVYRRGPNPYTDYKAYLAHPNVSVGAEVWDWVSRCLDIDIYI